MLKVVCLVDKTGTALDRLAKGVAKYHDNLNYVVCDVHPKRPDKEQLERFYNEAFDADIIDAQYYRSLYKLRELIPWLNDKKTILTHNNPYAIEEQSWNDVDYNIGNNEYITKRLGEITEKPVDYIPLTVDTDFWQFNPDWKFGGGAVNGNTKYNWQTDSVKPQVVMVANRIESKKGILEVAKACHELDVKFVLVGAISDGDYFHQIMQVGSLEFHEKITDEELRSIYYNSTIHVCNSADKFESGTMPILESMLCGVPVLTRKIGHVPELYNGENMVINEAPKEDVESIKKHLFDMLSDKKKLLDMREKAWQTAKTRSFERRAYAYQKLYRKVMWPEQQAVSVVVPVYDKPEIIRKCLDAIASQSYKNIEIIVADDNWHDNKILINDFARFVSFPVRYIKTSIIELMHNPDFNTSCTITLDSIEDYGLARARNEATIEATGDIIIYCDQRQVMQPNAVEEFVKHLGPDKVWLYGNKGVKKEFVENFSCVRRSDIINAGMFCERITAYGGMSQECRTRFKNQGGRTEYVESAKADPAGKSSNRNRKRQDIIKMKNRLAKMFEL